MAFNIGLSGIRAASTDLEVTGNNVANASTVGFKESRAEFADIYTTTLLGTGSKPVGSGVLVENVRQEFSQGNISGTENALDMAIDGNGFFILNDGGKVSYTRAGYYGLDKDGYVVSNNGARLQGYEATDQGVASGVLDDLQIVIGNQPPKLTARMASILNLDASEEVLQEMGQRMVSGGLAIATPDAGIADSTATTLETVGQATTAGTRTSYVFDIGTSLNWRTAGNMDGTVAMAASTIDIDPLDGSVTPPVTVNIAAVAAAGTRNQMITDVLASIQNGLDSAFGANEVVARTEPEDFAVAIANGTDVFFTIERAGFDATTGLGFTPSNATGGWLTHISTNGALPATDYTYTAGTAGQQLFVGSNPLKADFRSIPGTSTTTRTQATPPLGMVDFAAGSAPVLSGTSTGPFDFTGLTNPPTFTFTVSYTDNLGTNTPTVVTLHAGSAAGFPTPTLAQLATYLDTLSADWTVAAGAGGLEFTGVTNPNGASIALVQGTENAGAASDTDSLAEIGFATTNRVAAGTADTLPNNLFSIQVTDLDDASNSSAAWDITIPQSTYASLDDLAAAIQAQLDPLVGPTGVSGRVSVSAVGGQIVFTNTEVGDNFRVTLAAHSTDPNAAAAFGSTGLGFDSMQVSPGTDTVDKTNTFRISLTVPAPDLENRSGTTTVTLDEEFRSVQQVAAAINRQIAALDSEAYIGVRAEATEIVPNVVPPEYKLRFVAIEDGEASTITVNDFIASGADVTVDEMYGLIQMDEDSTSLLTQGIEGVTNEYPAQQVTLTDPDGNETVIETDEDAEANEIAAIFNRQAGVTASASSELTIPLAGYNNPGNTMTLTLNGQALTSTSIPDLIEEINSYQTTTLPGFTASTNSSGDLIIQNSIGRDIKVELTSPTVTDSIIINGSPNAGPVVLGGTATADVAAVVGGTIEFILNENYTLSNPVPSVSGVFGALSADEFTDYTLNVFDPTDQTTYNHATSTTIYDSLGNSHIMTQYFVKEPIDPTRPTEENIWAMYVLIDENDVGDPDPTLSFPENLEPTRARYELFFNPDGTLDTANTGELYVTNWDPLDSQDQPTGALKSLNVLEGGLPLTEPANSSNFQILLDGSTQFGSAFSVNEVSQDGYTTGRLTGLEIDQDGVMFARFTNGQAQVLGQVAFATFKNPEGLIPLGDTSWGESFESGTPTVGTPRSGTFGNLRSSALEDSNVDLSEELVGLIIAQRNFQASAKTIETSDTVTQTIIQL